MGVHSNSPWEGGLVGVHSNSLWEGGLVGVHSKSVWEGGLVGVHSKSLVGVYSNTVNPEILTFNDLAHLTH